jgi:integrase/recombinase XerD
MCASLNFPSVPLARWLQLKTSSSQLDTVEHFLLQFQSSHTRRSYLSDIDSFFFWWDQRQAPLIENLQDITEKHVLLWLEQFSESSTRARKMAALSSFLQFCADRQVISHNPCRLLKRPKISTQQTTQALDTDEATRLLETLAKIAFDSPVTDSTSTEPAQNDHVHKRHARRKRLTAHLRFAVIHTLLSVGMRVDELCELRVADLLFHPPQFKLRFVSKGGEEHITVVSQSCADVITHYLQTCRKNLRPDDFVFSRVQESERKSKLSQTAIFQMFRSAALSAGINKTLSPHSARATVATVLHRQGVPLGFIQRLLNHKQITTTAHYVKKANERSESAALKAPVSAWIKTGDAQESDSD